MITLVALLIVIGAIGVVLWPLFRSKPVPYRGQSWERERLESLLARRDSAYDAIRDLEFEYQVGNLSKRDYLELRERYRLRAARVLEEMDGLPPGEPPQEDKAEVSPRPDVPERDLCPACGQPREAGYRFCRHCGAMFEVGHDT